MFTPVTATAKNLRALLDTDDATLKAARTGAHGPVAAYAADEFTVALRTVERRDLLATAALHDIIAEAQGELTAGGQGYTRRPARFSTTAYTEHCAAVTHAAAQAECAGRVLAGLLGVAFDGVHLADLV